MEVRKADRIAASGVEFRAGRGRARYAHLDVVCDRRPRQGRYARVVFSTERGLILRAARGGNRGLNERETFTLFIVVG